MGNVANGEEEKGGTIVSSFRVTRNFGVDHRVEIKRWETRRSRRDIAGGTFCIVRYRDWFPSSLSFAPFLRLECVSNDGLSLSLSRRCRGQHRLIRKLCGKERKEEGVHAVGSSLHYSKRPSRETRRACRKTSECKLLTTRERAKCRSMSREIINEGCRVRGPRLSRCFPNSNRSFRKFYREYSCV